MTGTNPLNHPLPPVRACIGTGRFRSQNLALTPRLIDMQVAGTLTAGLNAHSWPRFYKGARFVKRKAREFA